MNAIRNKWSRQKARPSSTHAPGTHGELELSHSAQRRDIKEGTKLSDITAILDDFSKAYLSFGSESQYEIRSGAGDTLKVLLDGEIGAPMKENRLEQWIPQGQTSGTWVCRICGSQERQHPYLNAAKGLEWIRRSVTFEALKSSCDRCDFCYILVEGILAFYKQNKPPGEMPIYVTIDCWPGYHCKVIVESHYTTDRGTRLSIFAQNEDLPGLPYIPTGCQPKLDLRLNSILATLHRWISDSQTHNESFLGFLPLRVLDVGAKGPIIRLMETRHERGLYTTLSHCWGNKQLITTTKKNLQKRIDGMFLGDLPRTFREAVMITRFLGIRYLWIDSLCILQDSPTDWEIQSSLMGDIFSNSYITIAAAAAIDSSQGCLTGQPTHRQTVSVTCPIEKAPGVKLFVGRQTEQEDAPGFHGDLPRHLLSMPLCTRGWTMQELMLSPRILYFAGDDVFWECQQGLQCHCPNRHVWQIAPMKSMLIKSKSKDHEKNPRFWFKEWRELVENYSKRILTKQTDILPALSGIARRHQTFHRSQYLAGLWESELLMDLFWSRPISFSNIMKAEKKVIRPVPSCAPTWSWASVQGPVDWQNKQLPDKFEQPATVISAACQVGKNPWGQPLSGELKLKGILFNVILDIHQVSGNSGTRCCQICVDSRLHSWDWISRDQVILDVEDFTDEDRFTAFRVGVRTVPFKFESTGNEPQVEVELSQPDDVIINYSIHYYLILKRVLGIRGLFKRVGIFMKTVQRGEKWNVGSATVITII